MGTQHTSAGAPESADTTTELETFERFVDEAAELAAALLPFDGVIICTSPPDSTPRYSFGPFRSSELPWLISEQPWPSWTCCAALGEVSVRRTKLRDEADVSDHWGHLGHHDCGLRDGGFDGFEGRARALGIESYAVFPLRLTLGDTSCLGAVIVLSRTVREVDSPELAVAARLADMIGATVERHLALIDDARRVRALEDDVRSRTLVEQAKGFLAGHLRVSIDVAHHVVHSHAQRRRVSLAVAAREILDGDPIAALGAGPGPDRWRPVHAEAR